MQTIYFDHISPSLLSLTPSCSTLPRTSCLFLITHWVQVLLPIHSSIHWGLSNSPGATPIKNTDFPSSNSHQLPVAPQSVVRAHGPLPLHTGNVDCLDHVQVTTAAVTSCVQLSCPVQKTLLHHTFPNPWFLQFLCPTSIMITEIWERGRWHRCHL